MHWNSVNASGLARRLLTKCSSVQAILVDADGFNLCSAELCSPVPVMDVTVKPGQVANLRFGSMTEFLHIEGMLCTPWHGV
jgi:hypothetical protein